MRGLVELILAASLPPPSRKRFGSADSHLLPERKHHFIAAAREIRRVGIAGFAHGA